MKKLIITIAFIALIFQGISIWSERTWTEAMVICNALAEQSYTITGTVK